MSGKTLGLIIGLVLVTVVLVIIALRNGTQQTQTKVVQKTIVQPTPTPVAHSTLMLSPNPVEVVSAKQGTVSVLLDTSDNKVTAVQLELIYDPLMISNVKITPGKFIPNAVVLINKTDIKTGRITYAIGIQPNQPTLSGQGSVAEITFTARGAAGSQSHLTLLPTTLVTALSIPDSVLKSSNGTVISIVGTQTITPTP